MLLDAENISSKQGFRFFCSKNAQNVMSVSGSWKTFEGTSFIAVNS